jgi:vancomycin resistance protein VanW
MRRMVRKIIPASLRLQGKRLLNTWINMGYTKDQPWAYPVRKKIPQQDQRKLNQPIKKTSRSDNKIHNIQLAIKSLNGTYLAPQQAFSFWQLVGPATAKRGYKSGRNLIDGILKEDYGGGLCQLAGIIYHTALLAGIEILERHNHSIDIYEEHERYTPLGADATVVFGYKDLKLCVIHIPFLYSFSLI